MAKMARMAVKGNSNKMAEAAKKTKQPEWPKRSK